MKTGVPMEELSPVVDAIPLGRLVGYKRIIALLLCSSQFYNPAERFFHGDTFTTELIAQTQEKLVECPVVQVDDRFVRKGYRQESNKANKLINSQLQ